MIAGVDDTIAPSGNARTLLINAAASKLEGATALPLRYGASVAAFVASKVTRVPSGSDV
jgi:hypothetical protein